MNLNLFDGEAYDTLEAALAFIDECGASIHFSDESSASSNESSSSSPNKHTNPVKTFGTSRRSTKPSARNPTKTRPVKSKRNRSRDRQRLELLQLRAEAQVLQQRVDGMRSKQRKECDAGIAQLLGTTQAKCLVPEERDTLLLDVWRDLTKRTRKQRKEAEQENRHLRDLYSSQVTTIKVLKGLLRM